MSRTRIVVIITLGLVLLGTVVVPLVGAGAPVECVLAIPEPQRLWFCRGIRVNASDDTYVCKGTVEPGEQGIMRYGNDLPENGPGCGSSGYSWGLRIRRPTGK